MKLTKFDLARLRNFQRSRENAPTAIGAFWRVKWLLLMMGILAMAIFFIPVPLSYRCFALGFAAGGCVCLVVVAVKLDGFWPLTREVLNWDRIEELVKEHDKTA